MKTDVAEPARDVGFMALGLQIGASLTPETATRLAGLPLAAVGLVAATAAAMAVAYVVLRRLAHWDRATAFLASAPGAFSTTLALIPIIGADDRRVITAQTLRLAVLVALLPLAFVTEPVGTVRDVWQWRDVAIALPLAAVAGFGLQRVGAPAAWILGPAAVSALLSVTSITVGQPAAWAFNAGLLVIGAASGARVRGGKRAQGAKLKRADLVAMAAALLAMLIATTVIAAVTATLTPLPFTALMLAYTPGGFEAMVALAAALDLEPALVSAAHVTRVLSLTIAMPWMYKLMPSTGVTTPATTPPDQAEDTDEARAGVAEPPAR